MDKIYEAMRLDSAEFECLEAISIDGYIPRDNFYGGNESVSDFPLERINQALDKLHHRGLIILTPFSIMLTAKGKRVIEFDESTARVE